MATVTELARIARVLDMVASGGEEIVRASATARCARIAPPGRTVTAAQALGALP